MEEGKVCTQTQNVEFETKFGLRDAHRNGLKKSRHFGCVNSTSCFQPVEGREFTQPCRWGEARWLEGMFLELSKFFCHFCLTASKITCYLEGCQATILRAYLSMGADEHLISRTHNCLVSGRISGGGAKNSCLITTLRSVSFCSNWRLQIEESSLVH